MSTASAVLLMQALAHAQNAPRFDEHWHANNIRASRTTKRALISRIRVVPPFPRLADGADGAGGAEPEGSAAADSERARVLGEVEALLLSSVLPLRAPHAPPRDSEAFAGRNALRMAEYFTYYDRERYSMAGCDLPVELAARLVHDVLRLGPDDSLIDLGSSTGVLCLTASCVSNAARVAGVELSPSRIEQAHAMQAALAALRPDAAARIELAQGDLLTAPLAEFNVLFCAVQPSAALRLMPQLLDALLAAHRQARARAGGEGGAGGRHVELRFFCAGFDLPTDVRGAEPRLVCGHAFAPRADGEGADGVGAPAQAPAAEDAEGGAEAFRGVPLYGGRGEGPRVVLEYLLRLDLDDGAEEGGGGADGA